MPPRTSSRLKAVGKSRSETVSIDSPDMPQVEGVKRKRRGTVGTSAKPPTKRAAVTDTSEDTSLDNSQPPSAIDDHSSNKDTGTTHHYGTRRSNNLHPARTAGVGKRTQAEVQAQAAVKKAQKQSKLQSKQQSQQDELDLENDGMFLLANLLNAHEETDRVADSRKNLSHYFRIK
ncbi:hypothetical protein BDY19DRAFT_909984 [Irpex rosettiformis]|uniref:Uncharacterized protein n=1 Tax=Irpex rosettiformis TaxID=378272 RepID=A0ACB8TQC8_9APHY|nr:hypothetical protein BDY19DRAFT_909984 [Irpex rosettiformis]